MVREQHWLILLLPHILSGGIYADSKMLEICTLHKKTKCPSKNVLQSFLSVFHTLQDTKTCQKMYKMGNYFVKREVFSSSVCYVWLYTWRSILNKCFVASVGEFTLSCALKIIIILFLNQFTSTLWCKKNKCTD